MHFAEGETPPADEVLYFVVSGDSVEESPVGSGLYNHELALIEPTKYAECVICDTITYTNSIGRIYTDGASEVVPKVDEG